MSYARMSVPRSIDGRIVGEGSDVYVLRMAGTPWIACYDCGARGKTFYMLRPERVIRHLREEHVAKGQAVPAEAINRLRHEASLPLAEGQP